jgi:alpha-galactosidase
MEMRLCQRLRGTSSPAEIERDKLSLQEITGYLKDHVALKESMKLYFQILGTELAEGLVLLHDDTVCVKMADYIFVGGVANVFVEYHGEDDNAENSSGSDFEDECLNMSDDEPDEIITAKPAESDEVIAVSAAESDEMVEMFVPNDNGVITHVISSPLKQPSVSKSREEMPGTDTDLQSVTITNSEEREHSSD